MLKNVLRHPLTKDLDIDDPRTTVLRKEIIRQKPFLRKIYEDWYQWIASHLPAGEGPVLELGSGAGFLKDYIPGLITSEVFFCPLVQVIVDGCRMPLRKNSLRAVVMVDVFHHIPDIRSFLEEALRCLAPGGKILMVEPWITPWSKFIYAHVHHEPVDAETEKWELPPSGPLSSANSALPWIVFHRDREVLRSEYPRLQTVDVSIEKPFLYLLSGGISYRSFMPGFLYGGWRRLESELKPWYNKLGMFARIELQKV